MLSIKNVSKHFGGVTAVDGCTFEVKDNTITSLIGPNGAGKTTLFNIISGLTKADKGKIIFQRHDITGLPAHTIAKS